jgi:hypothetical protein
MPMFIDSLRHRRRFRSAATAVRLLSAALTAGALSAAVVAAQSPAPAGGRTPRFPTPPEITTAAATGEAAAVLGLERKIEDAVVKGDVAFAETVLSRDFHFRHGDGWTRGEKTGGIEDDRAAFMKRIADKEYLVHDLDAATNKIEMHGDVAITWGRYVSLFVPKNRSAATPPRLTTIWFERVWAKRDGRWQWVSHRTVWGPNPSPAGVDPSHVRPEQVASYVPGLPAAKAAAVHTKPASPDAAELLDVELKFASAVPGGDVDFFDKHSADTFQMWHGDVWTRGGRSTLIDTKAAFLDRVKRKQYLAWHFDSNQQEMHGDIGITYGRYTATLTGSNPERAWFSVWYQRVYQKREGVWVLLSQRTVHGASYGSTRESVSEK